MYRQAKLYVEPKARHLECAHGASGCRLRWRALMLIGIRDTCMGERYWAAPDPLAGDLGRRTANHSKRSARKPAPLAFTGPPSGAEAIKVENSSASGGMPKAAICLSFFPKSPPVAS